MSTRKQTYPTQAGMRPSDSPSLLRRPSWRGYGGLALGLAACLSLTGCSGVLDLFGVYFPAWMVSVLLGLAATALVLAGLARSPWRGILPHPAVSFLSLLTFFSILAWFIFFRD
ncbi:MAG: YtcA family lipoprotein [Verrucomicrobiota bacterium]